MGQVEKSKFFVAVITEKFLANSANYLRYCAKAEEGNKPMYVIVKNGVDWSNFSRFPWRKIYIFEDEKSFDRAWDDIEKDIKYFEMVQTYGQR